MLSVEMKLGSRFFIRFAMLYLISEGGEVNKSSGSHGTTIWTLL